MNDNKVQNNKSKRIKMHRENKNAWRRNQKRNAKGLTEKSIEAH